MARCRMINKALISRDCFLQLSCATQLLYFHLCLNADDDGFVDNVITLIRHLPVGSEDLKTLIEKGYVLILDDYLYVITHWRQHNRIDKNHYVPTTYIDYLKKIFIDDTKAYTLSEKGINLFDYQFKRGFIAGLPSSDITAIEDKLKKN